MSKVWFGVLTSFMILLNVQSASLPTCQWESPSDALKNSICETQRSENLLKYNSCYESLQVFKDSLGRIKYTKFTSPLGSADSESVEEACSSETNVQRKRACMRMTKCTLKVDDGELVKNCLVPSSISEENLSLLGMPFDSNLPVAFVNDKGLMGADAIKEELCQGKDETCKGLTSVEMNEDGFVIGSSLLEKGTPDMPQVSKAKSECRTKYDENSFNYNYCVRMLKCPDQGECVFPAVISPEDDTNALGEPLAVSCLDEGDEQGEVVSEERDERPASTQVLPTGHRATAPEQAFESCQLKKGREKFLCYMGSLGQRPEKLIEACSISQERYEDFLESLDRRDGAASQNK
ncbi:hypothetical protein OAT67_04500 [Bacteriovoracaceae bacterium]|nr:hypothetical protein [Bacteriovoracaceae bacterium]